MHRPFKMVRDAVRQFPLPLLNYSEEIKKIADDMLPYTVGMEISINGNSEFEKTMKENSHLFHKIDYLTSREPQVCLKTGLDGFIGLWKLCEILKKTCQLNPRAGIHYNVGREPQRLSQRRDYSWVLSALDSWNYTGDYNLRAVNSDRGKDHVWVNLNRCKGWQDDGIAEFRIGEMTFDYELMVKRILHCTNIMRKLLSEESSTRTKLRKDILRW